MRVPIGLQHRLRLVLRAVVDDVINGNPAAVADYRGRTAALIEDVRQRFINPRMFEYKLKTDSPPLKTGDVAKITYADPRRWNFRFSFFAGSNRSRPARMTPKPATPRLIPVGFPTTTDFNNPSNA